MAASTTTNDTLVHKTKDRSVISGGALVAKALKNEGVDTIFTLCGGHIIDIYDGCLDEGIRIIDVRHEQTAATRRRWLRSSDRKTWLCGDHGRTGVYQRDHGNSHRISL